MAWNFLLKFSHGDKNFLTKIKVPYVLYMKYLHMHKLRFWEGHLEFAYRDWLVKYQILPLF